MKGIILKIVSTAACPLLITFGAAESIAQEQQSASLANSYRHILYSEEIDQSFRIDVAMPIEFPGKPVEQYSVVYILDGNSFLPLVSSGVRLLQGGLEIAPVILVGIGYDTSDTMEISALRDRELTPSFDQSYHDSQANRLVPLPIKVDSGGAEQFYRFIENSVKPLISENYPTNSNNETLAGYSLGGLFSTYVLFNHSESFDSYVLGSPSLHWDDGISFSYEKSFAENNTDLAKRVYITTGSLESERMTTNAKKMYDSLLNRNYPNLQIDYTVYDGETHNSGMGVALNRSLKSVFEAETEEYVSLLIANLTEPETDVGTGNSQQPSLPIDLSVLTNVDEKLTISLKPSLVKAFRNAKSTGASERIHYTNNALYYELENMDIAVFEFEESSRSDVIRMMGSVGSELVGNSWEELSSQNTDQVYSQALTLFSDDGSTLLGGILMAIDGDQAMVASGYGMIMTADIETADLEDLLDQSRYTNLFDND